MKLMSSFMLNTAALWACTGYGHGAAVESFRRGFELCVVARDANRQGVCCASSASGRALLINLPALLSSSDLKRAKAVSKSSWYVLSGSHLTSTLLLTLKPDAAVRVQAAIERVIGCGDQVAILLHGEIIGVLMFSHSIDGGEIAIDASFFSDGTEREKELEARQLARQIKATLY